MTLGDRLGLAARAFFLAPVLALALFFEATRVIQGAVFLVAIAVLALAAGKFSFLAPRWVLATEGILAGLAIGGVLPQADVLLPYLMVPTLLTGVGGTLSAVVIVSGFEVFGLVVVLALGGSTASLQDGIQDAAPWVVASLGAGFTAQWVTQLRGTPAQADEASYESARRLLSQLRTVARRLSSGLDPVSMASQILVSVHEALEDTQSAVFVRTEGGVLAPLGYRGFNAKQSLLPEGHLVDSCWAEMEPAHEHQASGLAGTRHRLALPLRSGSRMIGVVISEAPSAPEPKALSDLMYDLDEQALRLDTALVFDEVRSLATMEERQRLAREIHDGVAQEISALGYFIDDLTADAVTDSQRTKLLSLRSEISRVVSELRLSIFDLRSEISPAAGIGSALSDYVRAVGARSGLTVHLTLDEAPTRLRGEIETELLRIAQEAVTNARKHSHAENLWVDCRIRPPFARITVVDDGTGLGDPREDSYGLKIMRERADRIGATLEIGTRDDFDDVRGTRVAVTVGDESSSL
ncbi:MAG TPA: histidine kinase [Marmoricola sp.]|nr:histidine kinase [Marmoricola sp.]